MDVDDDNDMLARVAGGETLELEAWPALQIDILARLDKIAHTAFAIPDLPPPRQLRRSLDNGEPSSPSPMAEPSSQEADKENAPVRTDDEPKDGGGTKDDEAPEQPKEATAAGDDTDTVMERERENENNTETPNNEAITQPNTQPETSAGDPPSGSIAADPSSSSSSSSSSVPKLPVQLAAMLGDIKSHVQTFVHAPPHTLQRLADLILRPRAHYRALATYLHAVDRVVQVTSGLSTYPLPPAIPDMSSMHINGVDGSKDPAASVTWRTPTVGAYSSTANSTHAAVGSDEALGGALLTPIPWLTRRSPESVDAVSTSSGGGSTAGGSSSSGGGGGGGSGALIHSESTETIDGPNGMGSIETVSVSVNGVPSTGHARGVTQGELLRQEQRAGVVPVSQLSRNQQHQQHQQHQQQQQHAMQHHQLQSQHEAGVPHDDEHDDGEDADDEEGQHRQQRPTADAEAGAEEGEDQEEEEEEVPHARGPDEIGVGDTGPQTVTTSAMGEGGLEMQGIDLAAAVGRPPEEEEHHTAQERKRTPEGEKREEGRENEEEMAAAAAQSPEALGTKREAEEAAAGEPAKKLKEE